MKFRETLDPMDSMVTTDEGIVTIHVAAIEQAIRVASPSQCADLVGQLEQLKAIAWGRIMNGTGTPSQATPRHDELLTIPEVAQRLKISEYRAYELARQGKLPHQKIGKLVRVSLAQLVEFQTRLKCGN